MTIPRTEQASAIADPDDQAANAALTGAEIVTVKQAGGVVRTTLTAVAAWVIQTYQGFTQSGTGAVARTVQAKLSDIVHLRDFLPAAGDGSTDIYAAVVAATNKLMLTGGTVIYPAGVCPTSASLPEIPWVYHEGQGAGATQVKALGDFPVFLRNGAYNNVINGGGISRMTIVGYWNQNSAQRTNSYGIKSMWPNRAIYRDLIFFSCYTAMYEMGSWQTVWDNLSATGAGTQQNYNGFWQDEVTQTNPNNNAVSANLCIAENCANVGFRLINPNGSAYLYCQSMGSGAQGWYIGDPPVGTYPVQFAFFIACQADTTSGTGWQVSKGNAPLLNDMHWIQPWASNTGSGNGFWGNSMTDCTIDSMKVDGAGKSCIELDNCTGVRIRGLQGRNYNRALGGFSGVNLGSSTGCSVGADSDISTTYTSGGGGRSVDENGTSNNNKVFGNNLPNGAQQLGAASVFLFNDGVPNTKLSYSNGSGQSIANNSDTVVTGWTAIFDLASNFNAATGVFTAPAAGTYIASAAILFNATFPAGTNMYVKLAKNGSVSFISPSAVTGASATNPSASVTGVFNLAAGDTIKVVANQTSGSTVSLNTSQQFSFLTIDRLT